MDNNVLEYYTEYYFSNERPVPFKVKDNNYSLYIRPVTVDMYSFYRDNVGILLIDKNRISDAKIISMSYLQYLIDIVLPQNEEYHDKLFKILNLSLGSDYKFSIGHLDNNKPYIGIKNKENNLLCKITPKEFDKISEIILYYNDRNYDNRYISDDMRNAINEYYNLKFRDKHIPTLEEKKAFVSFKSGLTLKQINEMSYRYFDIVYDQCVANDLFFSQKIIQASEKYKVNDEIVYPLFAKKDTKFGFLKDAEQFEKQLSAAARGGQG